LTRIKARAVARRDVLTEPRFGAYEARGRPGEALTKSRPPANRRSEAKEARLDEIGGRGCGVSRRGRP
jgi:hypothetical protein